jgi:signal transduction histidine kinase
MSLWTLIVTLSSALIVVLLTNVFSPKTFNTKEESLTETEKEPLVENKEALAPSEEKILEGFAPKPLVERPEEADQGQKLDCEKMFEELKTEFLAVLSHELKTPLVSVVGYLDLIHSGKLGDLTDRQRHALDVSLKKTAHLNSLISSILNLAKLDAGKLELFLKSQRLIPIILESVDSLKSLAERKKLEIKVSHDVGLDFFTFDAALIARVILNLLENAIKYSHDGGKIEVRASSHGDDWVKIEVEDQGIGIPLELLGRVKLKFFQVAKTEAGPRGGLGIGLALAEKILAVHDSGLEILSEEGKGSCFSFCLKRAEPVEGAKSASAGVADAEPEAERAEFEPVSEGAEPVASAEPTSEVVTE